MKIIEEYKNINCERIEITKAQYLGDFNIKIIFSDKKEKLVGFKTFIENSLHPAIRKYMDENKFRNFHLIDGNLNWNDFDLIFPIEDLYKGSI